MYRYCGWLLILFLLGGCVALPNIEDIQDINIQVPDSRLPNYEKLTYKVSWLGLPVGTLTTCIIGIKNFKGRDTYVLEATMKTNAFLSKIYRIEDRFVSYMDVEKLHTLRYEVYRRDGGYKKDAITEFDQANHKAYFKNFIDKSEKSFDIPVGIHDVLSAYYYLMLLPLKVGDRVQCYVCNNEKNYQFSGIIQSKVLIRLPRLGKKKKEAFLMQPYAKLKGEKVDKGTVKAYFSCGKRRLPLLVILKGPIFTKVIITLSKIENK